MTAEKRERDNGDRNDSSERARPIEHCLRSSAVALRLRWRLYEVVHFVDLVPAPEFSAARERPVTVLVGRCDNGCHAPFSVSARSMPLTSLKYRASEPKDTASANAGSPRISAATVKAPSATHIHRVAIEATKTNKPQRCCSGSLPLLDRTHRLKS